MTVSLASLYRRALRARFPAACLTLTLLPLCGFFCVGCAPDLETPVKPAELSEQDKAIKERMKNNPPPPRQSGRGAAPGEK